MKSYIILIKTKLGWESAGLFATLGAVKRHLKHYDGKESKVVPVPYRGGAE